MKSKLMRLVAALAFVSALLIYRPVSAVAGPDCETGETSGVRRIFAAFDEQCRKHLAGNRSECFTPNVYNKVVPIMKALGRDSRFGPRDRILLAGETQNGSVLPGTEQIYYVAAPLDKDQITATFSRLAGAGGALIRICGVAEDGSAQRVGAIDIGADELKARSATLSGVQGKVIRISIAARGPTQGKLNFSLTVR